MGAIALGSPWLQSTSGFPMGAIALGSPWLIQMRISHGRHRPRISVVAIHIRISHGRHRPRISVAAIQIECVFRCGCLIFWIPNLTFTVSHVLVSTKSTIA